MVKVLKLYSHEYRIMIPMTYSKEETIKKIELYKQCKNNIVNPIKDTDIVDVLKVKINDYYGINIYTIKLKKIKINYNIDSGTYIHLIEKNGDDSDTCILTGNTIPYLFYYNGEKLIKTNTLI